MSRKVFSIIGVLVLLFAFSAASYVHVTRYRDDQVQKLYQEFESERPVQQGVQGERSNSTDLKNRSGQRPSSNMVGGFLQMMHDMLGLQGMQEMHR